MDPLIFAAGLDVKSGPSVSKPASVKTIPSKAPSNDELDAIELPDYGLFNARNGGHSTKPPSIRTQGIEMNGSLSNKTPDELERSQPSTPSQHDAVGIVPSFSFPKMNKYRVLAACLQFLGNGMNDSAPGALIPYIEKWYGIGYAIVSLIWITNAAGFIACAFATDFICGRLGRSRSLMLAEAFMISAYAVIASPVPFPAVVAAYFVLGFGNALNLALNNVFCSNLANSTVVLGGAHGCYGVGGIIGPLVATGLVSNGVHWSYFYFVTIGIRILCLISSGWSFRGYEQEETSHLDNHLESIASRQPVTDASANTKMKAIRQAFTNRTTIIGALFVLVYQGAEVAESGWFISYLIDYRNGDPAHVGFVTSGFWAGVTIGRFVLLSNLARRFGERTFVFALIIGTTAFQLLAWLIPNVIGDAVAVSILGLFLGPIIPCAQTIFARILPKSIQVFAIGFIFSAGSSGGALVPFLTGLLSQVAGTFVLHPICIGCYVIMIGCWIALPRQGKRND